MLIKNQIRKNIAQMLWKAAIVYCNEDPTNPTIVRSCSVKEVFLEILQNFAKQENTCARASFLIRPEACNFIKKETLAQVFSCEFCEISKNTFYYKTSLVAASE